MSARKVACGDLQQSILPSQYKVIRSKITRCLGHFIYSAMLVIVHCLIWTFLYSISSTIPSPGDKCSFSNCVPAHGIILEPALPPAVSISQLAVLYPPYKQAFRTFSSVNPANSANVTVIIFENDEHCK